MGLGQTAGAGNALTRNVTHISQETDSEVFSTLD